MGYTMQWIVPRTFFRVQYDRKRHFESKTNTCTCMLEDKYYFPWGKQILYMYSMFFRENNTNTNLPTKETNTSRIISTILFSISIYIGVGEQAGNSVCNVSQSKSCVFWSSWFVLERIYCVVWSSS